jgi:hypothetical protein
MSSLDQPSTEKPVDQMDTTESNLQQEQEQIPTPDTTPIDTNDRILLAVEMEAAGEKEDKWILQQIRRIQAESAERLDFLSKVCEAVKTKAELEDALAKFIIYKLNRGTGVGSNDKLKAKQDVKLVSGKWEIA